MTNTEAIYQKLKINASKMCDDCLSLELKIFPRQQVNQICNREFEKGMISRAKGVCDFCKRKGKFVNSQQ